MSVRLSMILAMSENHVIGKDNTMPWHLSDELKRFRRITTGHAIIMGRKTFESLGRPLPKRRNIVLTHQSNYQHEGVTVVGDLSEALACCADETDAFIIGGAQIYEQAYEQVDRLYLTVVHAMIEGDTLFDQIDLDAWERVESESYKASEKNDYDFTCSVYDRKRA